MCLLIKCLGHIGAVALQKLSGVGDVETVNWLSALYSALGKQGILVPYCLAGSS